LAKSFEVKDGSPFVNNIHNIAQNIAVLCFKLDLIGLHDNFHLKLDSKGTIYMSSYLYASDCIGNGGLLSEQVLLENPNLFALGGQGLLRLSNL
jgi:hypothetical protein